jgi:hypothetical protein
MHDSWLVVGAGIIRIFSILYGEKKYATNNLLDDF